MTGSNRRPSACKADALPAELITPRQDVAHYRDRLLYVSIALSRMHLHFGVA